MSNDPVATVSCVVNNSVNSGEDVTLTAHVYNNGDDENNVFITLEAEVQSYGNCVTLHIGDVNLRRLEGFVKELGKKIKNVEPGLLIFDFVEPR